MKATPIFLCCKDRASYLKRVVDKLREQGYENIHLVDTGSSFPKMIDYELSCGLPVYRVSPQSQPHLALWNCNVLRDSGYGNAAFVYSDQDVLPDVPEDWLGKLYQVLDRHPEYPKAGLALRIDDLPDHYARKQEVISWEQQFWREEIEPGVWKADIDTTLALHRPGVEWSMKALRLAGDYQAKHLPWYSDSMNPTDEEIYYREHMAAGVGHWR